MFSPFRVARIPVYYLATLATPCLFIERIMNEFILHVLIPPSRGYLANGVKTGGKMSPNC